MLRISLEPDDYNNFELTARVESEGFAGHGAGWFTDAEIQKFVEKLDHVANQIESEARLEGGPVGASSPNEYCVLIRVYPVDALGHFGVFVMLRKSIFDVDRAEQASCVALELSADSSSVEKLRADLIGLLKGTTEEVTLRNSEYS